MEADIQLSSKISPHPWNLPVMSSRKRSGGGSGHKSQQTMTAAFNSSSYTKIKEADLFTFVEKELSVPGSF